MAIQAIVFDIGGVLEYTPQLGISEKWEKKHNLESGAFSKDLSDVWLAAWVQSH